MLVRLESQTGDDERLNGDRVFLVRSRRDSSELQIGLEGSDEVSGLQSRK